jgi:trehalose-6-phosphate synthase
MENRLLIVSNRLPITARAVDDGVRLTAASGGLATGLRPHRGEWRDEGWHSMRIGAHTS